MAADRPLPSPRLLDAAAAAHYCGMTTRQFRALVRTHDKALAAVPGVTPTRWDKAALDRWLDRRSGIAAGADDRALEEEARRRLRKALERGDAGHA